MKTKKLTKKIANLILKKNIESFNLFTVEISSEAKYFFKKNNYSLTKKKKMFKHPLKLNSFKNIISLKTYLNNKKPQAVYIYINNVYIRQANIKKIYIENALHAKNLFIYFKKLYVIWFVI